MSSFVDIRLFGDMIGKSPVLRNYQKEILDDYLNDRHTIEDSDKIVFNTSVKVKTVSRILHVEFIFSGSVALNNRKLAACIIEISNAAVL
jgi:hypothetical protein